MIKVKFGSLLQYEEVDGRKFRLTEPLLFRIDGGGIGLDIYVPVGYVTDLASVPRFLWPIFPPFGVYSRAAVIHDYLLDNGHHRFLADAIFRECMNILGVPWYKRIPMFYAVRFYSLFVTWRKRHGVRRKK